MIKKNILSIAVLVLTVLCISCGDGNQYNLEKGKVGVLSTKTTIHELGTIFKNDSIVKNLSEGATGDNYLQEDDKYLIFEKGGKHLLTIIPQEQLDSTSTIKSVQIHDDRYKTATGTSLGSNFSEINTNNTINRVETSFSSATLFIDDLNATIAIDKEELGLKKMTMQKVTLEQIPDLAKIKSLIIWFN